MSKYNFNAGAMAVVHKMSEHKILDDLHDTGIFRRNSKNAIHIVASKNDTESKFTPYNTLINIPNELSHNIAFQALIQNKTKDEIVFEALEYYLKFKEGKK